MIGNSPPSLTDSDYSVVTVCRAINHHGQRCLVPFDNDFSTIWEELRPTPFPPFAIVNTDICEIQHSIGVSAADLMNHCTHTDIAW
jgi:hypothetical protein